MTTKTCTIDNCTNKLHAKGLCGKHYQAARHSGPAGPTDRTCSLPDCNSKHYAKGMCSLHYQRTKYKRKPRPIREATKCKEAGCLKPVRALELCSTHYARLRRNGSVALVPTYENLTGNHYGTLLVVERVDGGWLCKCDCGGERWVGFKKDLLDRPNPTCGDFTIHSQRKPEASYTAIHHRLRVDRGTAATYSCVDCGSKAQEWSYNNSDPEELEGYVKGNPVMYSTDLDNYDPRCIPCHRAFDRRNHELASTLLSR